MFTDESGLPAVSPRSRGSLSLIEGGTVTTRTCTIEGCARKHAAKGLCMMHYKRLQTTGTLNRYGVLDDPHAGTAVKTCRRCLAVKSRSDFTPNAMSADGYKGRCKDCENELLREKYATDPDYRNQFLVRMRRYKYGVEQADVDALYEAQGGKCGICKRTLPRDKFDVDHDHKTNEVRGLLHRKCNLVAGFFDQMDGAAVSLVLDYLNDPPMRRVAREKAI